MGDLSLTPALHCQTELQETDAPKHGLFQDPPASSLTFSGLVETATKPKMLKTFGGEWEPPRNMAEFRGTIVGVVGPRICFCSSRPNSFRARRAQLI